jgi:hypothetical protein
MTIKGRTSKPWGRSGARWDSHAENGYRSRSYPARPEPKGEGQRDLMQHWRLAGRPGAAEPHLAINATHNGATPMRVEIELEGWLKSRVELNERQAIFLRDTLNDWLSNPD